MTTAMISNAEFFAQRNLVDYLREVPFNVTPPGLYCAPSLYGEMMKDCQCNCCYDMEVYQHFLSKGKHTDDEMEMLARALHDFAIGHYLDEFLNGYDPRQVVGVMGGHGVLRTSAEYRQVVELSKELTERDTLMVTGGGPGVMEATHLGAWMAGRPMAEVDEALKILSEAPGFKDEGWLQTAFEVIRRYPQERYHSLGIPTWLYGHEPSAAFATDIAKYFDNSIRENTILTVAFGGIVFTPGSAGTMQEVFQEAVQNHYLSFGYASPMVFLGRKFWTKDIPVYPFLEQMMQEGRYKNLQLKLTDSSHEVVEELMRFRSE
ncbi:MAG: hypothetical protein J6M37_03030 [Prevotella sp.]|nr:hypothetical protein [Prevotella sp.]